MPSSCTRVEAALYSTMWSQILWKKLRNRVTAVGSASSARAAASSVASCCLAGVAFGASARYGQTSHGGLVPRFGRASRPIWHIAGPRLQALWVPMQINFVMPTANVQGCIEANQTDLTAFDRACKVKHSNLCSFVTDLHACTTRPAVHSHTCGDYIGIADGQANLIHASQVVSIIRPRARLICLSKDGLQIDCFQLHVLHTKGQEPMQSSRLGPGQGTCIGSAGVTCLAGTQSCKSSGLHESLLIYDAASSN